MMTQEQDSLVPVKHSNEVHDRAALQTMRLPRSKN
jgi:hypothetical protein